MSANAISVPCRTYHTPNSVLIKCDLLALRRNSERVYSESLCSKISLLDITYPDPHVLYALSRGKPLGQLYYGDLEPPFWSKDIQS